MIKKGFINLTDGMEDASSTIYNHQGWRDGTITLPWLDLKMSNHWQYAVDSDKKLNTRSAEVSYYKYLTKLPETTFSSKTEKSKVTLQDLV